MQDYITAEEARNNVEYHYKYMFEHIISPLILDRSIDGYNCLRWEIPDCFLDMDNDEYIKRMEVLIKELEEKGYKVEEDPYESLFIEW